MDEKSVKVKAESEARGNAHGKGVLQYCREHKGVFCVLGLLLITVVLFGEFLFSDQMLGNQHSDQVNALDQRAVMQNSVREHGQFPTWFSTRLGGMPTVDALFSDALYPPTFPINVLFPIHRAFGLKMVLHIFLAGLFFYLLLRKSFGCSRFVSFIGGAFYMLSPQFLTHVYGGHDGKIFVIAWLPFIIWSLKSLMETPKLLHATLLGAGIAMAILTPHVQLTYFALWGLFLYWVVSLIFGIKSGDERSVSLKRAGYFWVAVVIGLGLAFIQLFPAVMFVYEAHSVRGVDRGFAHATSWSLHWPEFFSIWVHEFGNALDYYWGHNFFKLNSEYVGAMPLLLSVLAIISKPRCRWRIFWAAVAVLSVLFAMGDNTPLFAVVYHIVPGVNRFRAPSMIMFWFTFSTVLLSVYFLKDMVNGRFSFKSDEVRKRWTKRVLISMGVVFLFTLVFSSHGLVSWLVGLLPSSSSANEMLFQRNFQNFDTNFHDQFVPALWLWFVFVGTVLGMFVALVNNKLNKNVLCFTILIIGLIDTARVNSQFIVTSHPNPYTRVEPAVRELQSRMKSRPFRVFSVGAFPQNNIGIHGLEEVSGFHDNELNWYRAFRGDQQDRNYLHQLVSTSPQGQSYLDAGRVAQANSFLNLANVEYILYRTPNRQLVKVENKNSLGRISFVKNYVVMEEDRIVGALKSGAYDYTTTVALLREPSGAQSAQQSKGVQAGGLDVAWKEYTPNYRSADVSVPDDGFLRISEVYYPGWEIRLNGERVEIYRADLAWMAIRVNRGEHSIEMMPKSIYLGKASAVTGIVFLMLLIYWVFMYVSYKRERTGADSTDKGP